MNINFGRDEWSDIHGAQDLEFNWNNSMGMSCKVKELLSWMLKFMTLPIQWVFSKVSQNHGMYIWRLNANLMDRLPCLKIQLGTPKIDQNSSGSDELQINKVGVSGP